VEEVCVKEGDTVQADEPIVRLGNIDARLRLAELEGEKNVTDMKLAVLLRQRHTIPEASAQIQQLRENLRTIQDQLQDQTEELDRLTVKTPVAGVVIPAPAKRERKQEGVLPGWSGSPLNTKNVGATYSQSELICRVGDPRDLEAILVVDQADIDFVDEAIQGDAEPEAKLQFDAFPGRSLTSRVVEVARVELEAASPQLSAHSGGTLDTKTDPTSGVQRPMSTSYQARVPLDDLGPLRDRVCTGMRGRAQVYTRPQSLGQRLFRYLARTFHFEL
jgi:putative peptide zinc metalloprotease protein